MPYTSFTPPKSLSGFKPIAPVPPVAKKPVITKYSQNAAPIAPVVKPKSYQYGEDVLDSGGKVIGQAKFDPNTGQPLINPNQSTTTISNANKMETVPKLNSQLDNLSNKGVTTNPETGQAQYADGSLYEEQDVVEADTTDEDKQINNFLEQQKASLDATTKSLIDNIQQKFAQRRVEQKEINRRQEKGVQNALLMGGSTGQGSSAQYAPISSSGIVQSQESYGIKQIAELDAQEQDLIASAKAAQASGDFKIMEKKMAMVEETRKAKIDAATKLNEKIAEQNQKLREENKLAEKESSISDLYSQGITDVNSIYQALQDSGIKMTTKQISDTLKNLVPPGLDDLVKTLRTNGAPQDIIQKVLSSQNINDAYKSAGSFAAGGTGIIGEYNYYKAQAQANGQVPMDFNQYQNVDANRKARVAAAANAAGLTSQMTNTALKLSDDYEQRSKDFYQQREAFNRIQSSASDPSPAGDLALIFNYMKVLDPGSTVREGEFANAQNAGSAFQAAGAQYNKVLNGKRLTDKQRQDFVNRATTLFNGAKKQQDSVANEFKSRAEQYGVPSNLVVRDTSATGSNAQDAVKFENDAKNKILAYGSKNPAFQPIITKKIKETNPFTGQKYTYTEILQIYPEIK